MEQLKSFSQYILKIGYKYGVNSVFDDFLEMVICSLSLGAKEDRYHEIVRNYEKPDAYLMAEAFGALVIEMDNKGEGLIDGFGDFYMEYLSHGHNGQFFTPEPICDMMARIINPAGFGERVADCCCGSGRMLLAAAKIKRNSLFFGADVDLALNPESVYYRSACQRILECPGRILWYVSQKGKFAGTKRIRACSRVAEVCIGKPKPLFKRFQRLGVYEWADVLGTARKDFERDIMAVRFHDTELLKPVAWETFQEVLRRHNIRTQLESPVRIPSAVFNEIYALALNSSSLR